MNVPEAYAMEITEGIVRLNYVSGNSQEVTVLGVSYIPFIINHG